MCLSRVYLSKGDEEDLLLEEVSGIKDENGIIKVDTIFGEVKKVKGHFIKEVNFLDNRLILGKKT